MTTKTTTQTKTTSRRNRTLLCALGLLGILAGGGVYWFTRPAPDALESAVIATNAAPADLVRFTATRSFTRLPVEDQMKYLTAWGMTPADVRSKTLAELMKEPYVLELSSANSSQTVKLLQSRQYFAASKDDRRALMDQIIDEEQEMVRQVEKVMKKAESDTGKKFDTKMGDQKLRKLLIETTPPEIRSELAAFTQAKVERMRERRMTNG